MRAGPAPASGAVSSASPRARSMSRPVRGLRRLLETSLSAGFGCKARRGDVKRPAIHVVHSADNSGRTRASAIAGWRTITNASSLSSLTSILPYFRQKSTRVPHVYHACGRFAGLATSASPSTLVIVESPAKAVSVQKYLGDDHVVLASYGHVRDLVEKAGSVIPANDFEMVWAERGKEGVVRDIVRAAKATKTIILATDPDREGEAISWHILELLKQKGIVGEGSSASNTSPSASHEPDYPVVQRVTFTEVTKTAVLTAFANPRDVSTELVDAYLARRALDYLFGFGLSGVLWRKMPSAQRLSAGRVQSVALRLICDKEFDIEKFSKEEYWSVKCDLTSGTAGDGSPKTENFVAELTHVHGVKLGKMEPGCREDAEAAAMAVLAANEKDGLVVSDVSEKDVSRKPKPPFTTSTMQQEASSKLGFGAGRTMLAAQCLYEGRGWGEGLITYMRTDGLHVSPEAVSEIRATATSEFGDGYVPRSPNFYKKKQKNAQEAHEAIRPTYVTALPHAVANRLGADSDESRLYRLIWARTMASQMTPAVMKRVVVEVGKKLQEKDDDFSLKLRANGSRLVFPGYLAAYGSDFDSRDSWLPPLSTGDSVCLTNSGLKVLEKDKRAKRGFGAHNDEGDMFAPGADDSEIRQGGLKDTLGDIDPQNVAGVTAQQHWTQPPGRYTEGTLVKALEEKGIGRPSTYASILKVISKRGYITSTGGRGPLIPETRGRLVSSFLSHFFSEYVNYGFTAELEDSLDDVANGERRWKDFLGNFYAPFSKEVENLKQVRTSLVVDVLDATLGVHFFGDEESTLERQMQLISELNEKVKDDSDPNSPYPQIEFDVNQLSEKRKCPSCGNGRLGLKLSRTGGFIGCSNYPECGHTGSLVAANGEATEGAEDTVQFPLFLGTDPNTNRRVSIRNGPYGPYLELEVELMTPEAEAAQKLANEVRDMLTLKHLEQEAATEAEERYEVLTLQAAANGEKPPKKKKPKKVKLPKPKKSESQKAKRFGLRNLDINVENVTLDLALDLLKYPLMLGNHHEDNEPVIMNAGPFGWYVSHSNVNASLSKKVLREERQQAVKKVRQEFGKSDGDSFDGFDVSAMDDEDQESWARAGVSGDDEGYTVDMTDGSVECGAFDTESTSTPTSSDDEFRAAVLRASFGPVSLKTAMEVLTKTRSKPPGKGRGWGRKKKSGNDEKGDDTETTKVSSKKEKEKSKPKPKPKLKRAPSAYLLYCASARGSLPEGLKVTEQARLLGASWKSLCDSERVEFKTAAKEAKEALTDDFDDDGSVIGKNKKIETFPKKKRTPSAYLLYCAEARASLPSGLKVPEQAKLLGASWKNLGDSERVRFENAAKQAKEEASASA